MNRILVPTDFSFNAEKALEYALHLAVYFKSEVILLHAWDLPHQKSAMFISMQERIKKKAGEDLQVLKEKISDRFPELKIRTVLMMGEAAEIIKTAAKNLQADLIVMGTKGASGLTKYFLGSITGDVIEDAPCPVFAVPEKTYYRNIKIIGFATDFDDDDLHSIGHLMPLAKLFNAAIDIVHVGEKMENEAKKLSAFEERIRKRFGYKNVTTDLLSGKDVVEGINQFVRNKNIDILGIARKKRDFLDTIFHKSVSKEITYSSAIPIIVFQSEPDVIDIDLSDEDMASSV